jgi:hypothetical protein
MSFTTRNATFGFCTVAAAGLDAGWLLLPQAATGTANAAQVATAAIARRLIFAVPDIALLRPCGS